MKLDPLDKLCDYAYTEYAIKGCIGGADAGVCLIVDIKSELGQKIKQMLVGERNRIIDERYFNLHKDDPK